MLSVPERQASKVLAPPRREDMVPSDEKLFVHLKELRKSLAVQEKVPPYVIFPDKSLKEMARIKPQNNESFRVIPGVGDYKREKYGRAFLSAIRAFQD